MNTNNPPFRGSCADSSYLRGSLLIYCKNSLVTVMLAVLSAACLAVGARAGDASVDSTADSGAGSLRAAITDINGAGGITNTISWYVGGSGTLTLLSDLPSVNYATTWDVSDSVYDFTLADSTNSMSIAAALTIYNNSVQST